jgi:hypothetical protein
MYSASTNAGRPQFVIIHCDLKHTALWALKDGV